MVAANLPVTTITANCERSIVCLAIPGGLTKNISISKTINLPLSGTSAGIFDDSTGSYRHDSLDAPFKGQYFFRNGTLIHYVITETGHHFESEKEDIESSVKEEAASLKKDVAIVLMSTPPRVCLVNCEDNCNYKIFYQ